MRIIFTIFLFFSSIITFARNYPAGTKSISISSFMADYKKTGNHFDLCFESDLSLGYFFLNNLEVFFGFGESKVEYLEEISGSDIGLGVFYHYPFKSKLSFFTGTTFAHNTGSDLLRNMTFDLGAEVFITENTALRIANRFLYYFDDYINEPKDNTMYLKFGLACYL
jgi:hypothetical protein